MKKHEEICGKYEGLMRKYEEVSGKYEGISGRLWEKKYGGKIEKYEKNMTK